MKGRLGRIAGRIAAQMSLILHAHVLNPLWRPRDLRRVRRYAATRGAALGYLRRYEDDFRSIVPAPPAGGPEPERAFTIWFQGEDNAPELVRACFRSMRRNLSQEVVVLDEKSLFDWITLPDYIIEKWRAGKIRHAHFSDICRVELLYRHGGLWLDATDYVLAPVPRQILDADFFMFMSGSKIRGSYSFVQNCFIRARKGDPMLGIWRAAIWKYWENEDSVINYFTHHLIFNLLTEIHPGVRRRFAQMPRIEQDPTHTLWEFYRDRPYDREFYDDLASKAFFQKTNFKCDSAKAPAPGSIAEHMLRQ